MKGIILIAVLISLLLLSACKDSSSPTSTNLHPDNVAIMGPTNCTYGQTYIYRVKSQDPDGERVAFHFNIYTKEMKLLKNLGWSPYVDNHKWYEISITWNYGIGEFILCTHCKDELGLECWNHITYRVEVN